MKKEQTMKLKIIPIGGLGLIGMNMTAFEYNESIVIVDCGMAFPENDMLGIDIVIPDVTYLKENISKVKGMVFTHGHEDHIGALPYILKELNVPLIALAQLSRAGAQRSDKRPILSDLRDSGAIEQDADVIMFLHREEYYDPNTEDKNIAEVIVAKQRNGPLGTVKLAWLGQYTRFASLQQGGAAQ